MVFRLFRSQAEFIVGSKEVSDERKMMSLHGKSGPVSLLWCFVMAEKCSLILEAKTVSEFKIRGIFTA